MIEVSYNYIIYIYVFNELFQYLFLVDTAAGFRIFLAPSAALKAAAKPKFH